MWLGRLMKGLCLVCGFAHCLSLPLKLPTSISIKQRFPSRCASVLCVQLLPSIHHGPACPLQVPGQHFLIAFLVPVVMLQAALLLGIRHQAIVAVRYLSHMTSPAKCTKPECHWATSQDVAQNLIVISSSIDKCH